MKKKPTSDFQMISNLYIYRDDLEEIYNLLHRYSDSVVFTVDEYELDSADELGQLKKKQAEKVEFSISKPYIAIKIKDNGASIYAGDNEDINANAITNKFVTALKKRKRPILFEFMEDNYLKINMVLWLLLAFCLIFHDFYYPYPLYLAAFLFGIFLIASGIVLFPIITKKDKTIVSLSYKKDSPSFFQRNRDAIVVEIIIGIIILVLGAILGKLL